MDDLLGPRRSDRLKAEKAEAESTLSRQVAKKRAEQFTDEMRPMSVTQMTLVFRMDRQAIKRKIKDLDPIGYKGSNQPLYDFRQVMPYLVEPKLDYREIIKSMNPNDLPLQLQKEYWASRRSEQLYRKEAGELWHTEDIMKVFTAATQKFVRGHIQMISIVEAKQELTAKQREIITGLADGLLTGLQRTLSAFPLEMETLSSEADLDNPEGDKT